MKSGASISAALAAAFLFGASTPLAKSLLAGTSPVLLAGLLYLGSGLGLWILRVARDRGFVAPAMSAREWPWLGGAILSGGVLGPVFLLFGLARTSAADTSLLLNLESALTALIAWIVFRENAGSRVVTGMALIVAGGLVLALSYEHAGGSHPVGVALVAAACLCWAIDNNLTRKVSASDAMFIAGTKGLAAGATNLVIALALGAHLPAPRLVAQAMAIGLGGYGFSLVLFVLALRGLGSARTGAYFSTAPFIGAAVAILFFHDAATPYFWFCATLMGIGVWLHLTERHEHLHFHEPLAHAHSHRHDDHHQHDHPFEWDGREPHSHPHRHTPMTHRHRHDPDIHHQHSH